MSDYKPPGFHLRKPAIIGYIKGRPVYQVAGATTFDELVIAAQVEIAQAEKQRERALAVIKYVHDKVRREGRSTLTLEEDAEVAAAMDTHTRTGADLEGAKHKLEQLQAAVAAERVADRAMEEEREGGRDPKDTAKRPAYDRVARVGREERTYHSGNDRKGGVFLRDVAKQFLYRDLEAETRLSQHMQEERVERGKYLERAVGTTAFTGLTVPQYLTDMYAPAVAALRPFADVCNHHDLPPDGMTVNISRITTATSAALQASQNAAVSETNIADTILTENVQTAAGQQTLSRQAIDRSTGVEPIVMDDLFRRYATTLDSTLLNQATTGLAARATSQTFTAATPTTAAIYAQTIQAAASVEAALLGFAQPDIVVMHSRRWYSMLASVTPNWPMITTRTNDIPVQALASNFDQTYARAIRGMLATGLAVVVDNNVVTNLGTGTNQDQMYVTSSQECHLWEDPAAPVFIRAEQPAAASLGVLLVLYGYFAYTFGRFTTSAVKIDGTGLGSPGLFLGT